MKISIIGAGNVGSTCADVLVKKNIGKEIILLDSKKGIAEGKALDIAQSSTISGNYTKIKGVTEDYKATAQSNIVIITAGLKRKTNMSREELIFSNSKIIEKIATNIIDFSPNAVFIVVSNPLDVMTYHLTKKLKTKQNRIIGMGCTLDTARYIYIISNILNINSNNISTLIIGGHNDKMVILPRYTTISGIPLSYFLNKQQIETIINQAKYGGKEIIELLGTSAWYAPGAAVAKVVEAIAKDQKAVISASVKLDGQYDVQDCCVGVPIIVGKEGVEKILEIDLTNKERDLFIESVDVIKDTNRLLNK